MDRKIKLIAKTRKGKNILSKHGNLWKIIKVKQHVPCVDGTGLFIQSLQSNDTRWIAQHNDEDIKIDLVDFMFFNLEEVNNDS